MQKNAIYLFSGIIALTTAFLLFAMDVLKESNKNDASFLVRNAWFNHGIQLCLVCLPLISLLTYILAKRESGNSNELILGRIRLLTFIIAVVDVVGIHCIMSPFRLQWYSKSISFATFSSIGLGVGIIVYYIFNELSKK